MSDVLRQVQETIQAHGLLEPGDRVVVGLSGGPDSLCLLHVLLQLLDHYDLHLHVGHLNHSTRGTASDADADFARATAAEWNLPITVEKRDVPGLAERRGLALEEAARRTRYAFLARIASRIGARSIAVGHNADDQAETVLMHLVRGSGLAGLRGMLPRTPITNYRLLTPFSEPDEGAREQTEDPSGPPRDQSEPGAVLWIVRPLLKVTRADIEQYCAEHRLRPRFDRSNLDTTYFRNRLRHELLPELETYNPQIRERLCHTAEVAAADYDLLVSARRDAWERIVRDEREDVIVFDQTAWQRLPVSLQRATLREAAYRLRRTLRDVSFVHVENARQLALEGQTGKESTLPMGLRLRVGYETLTIGDADKAGPPPDEPMLWTDEPLAVPVPGTTPLPETEWVFEAQVLDEWSITDITAPNHPWTAFLDAQALTEPLVVRPRRAGDRLQPLGMGGHHVTVSELMINLKIPEPWRDHVPLLVAGARVLWVCGHRIAETAKVRPETQQVVRFGFDRAN